jgi:hypothetical protein
LLVKTLTRSIPRCQLGKTIKAIQDVNTFEHDEAKEKAWEENFKGYLHYMKKKIEGHRTAKLLTTLIRELNLCNLAKPNNEPFSPLKEMFQFNFVKNIKNNHPWFTQLQNHNSISPEESPKDPSNLEHKK